MHRYATLSKLTTIPFVILFLTISAQASMAAQCITGSTGLIKVPSVRYLPPATFEMGAHVETYSAVDLLGAESHDQRIHLKGNYGVLEGLELGFKKTFDSTDVFEEPDIVINGKFTFEPLPLGKFTVGLVVDSTINAYNSVYVLYGSPTVFFGLGGNFGGASNRLNNWAHFGGYDNLNFKPESFFFLAGAEFEFGQGRFMLEYDGGAFNAGLRYLLTEQFTLDLFFMGENDYDEFYEARGPWSNKYNRTKAAIGISSTF
ncbi:MAG: hypothetical protein QGH40_01625 [bacterium]|nr:hypothetical protein [bacterium]